jgi:hypothetical protein
LTIARALREKKLYDVGEITNLMANKDYSKISRKYIEITKVYQKALGTFTDIEAQKEGFKDLTDFIAYWKKNIGVWKSSHFSELELGSGKSFILGTYRGTC